VDLKHIDDHLLVVVKPPGLLSQPDHTGDVDVVARGKHELAAAGHEAEFLGLVHRLDRPASGIMVLARTSDAARNLSRQFRERTAEKQYLVLVEGRLGGVGTWTDYIAKPDRTPTLVAPDDPEGKRAVAQWQALHVADDHTLLRVELKTGRPHQIRLQASDRGHPVLGDHRYGASTTVGDRAIALHHALLRIEHPGAHRRSTFTAPPPEAWHDHLTPDGRAALERMLAQARMT
jgi:tRNA pseudouridine32 synthase/23S rRNA pseudouridine746 synthase/23S rRNA pseudouridine1911/1915/1917 synthase